MKRILMAGIAVLVLIVAANAALATVPSTLARSQDSRNAAVNMQSYYRWGIDPTTLVVDVWDISGEATMADVDRALLDTAAALRSAPLFSHVELAFRGSPRFEMDGAYFRQLGEEREWQNPVYTMRTMAENMTPLDGGPRFEVWTGGMLGVVGQQLQDHNSMHERWYLLDWAGAR